MQDTQDQEFVIRDVEQDDVGKTWQAYVSTARGRYGESLGGGNDLCDSVANHLDERVAEAG